MAKNKTQPTETSVESYLAGIADEARRKDCRELVKLMKHASREEPRMWGAGIVGFGSYHYQYESGREGDSCLTGFSSRKGNISVYLSSEFAGREALLARLGKHKTAKACLYIRSLADIDAKVLEQMVAASVAAVKLRHET